MVHSIALNPLLDKHEVVSIKDLLQRLLNLLSGILGRLSKHILLLAMCVTSVRGDQCVSPVFKLVYLDRHCRHVPLALLIALPGRLRVRFTLFLKANFALGLFVNWLALTFNMVPLRVIRVLNAGGRSVLRLLAFPLFPPPANSAPGLVGLLLAMDGWGSGSDLNERALFQFGGGPSPIFNI